MANAKELFAMYTKIFAQNDADPRLSQIEAALGDLDLQIQMAEEPKFLKETAAYDVVAMEFQLLNYRGDVVDQHRFTVRVPHNGEPITEDDAPTVPISTLPRVFELDTEDLEWLGSLGENKLKTVW